jgi:hypothetical protein
VSSTTIDPLAEAIKGHLTISLSGGITMNAYKWDPGFAGISPPCGVVGVPSAERTPPGEGEESIGANDWSLEFPVQLFFDLADPVLTQSQAVEAMEAFIVAIDADQTLGNLLLRGGEARVVRVEEPEELITNDRPLFTQRCRVALKQFV